MSEDTTMAQAFMKHSPAENRDIGVITMEIKTLHRQAQQVDQHETEAVVQAVGEGGRERRHRCFG